MAPPRLLGVFAHPDDESFCAGGTLAKYAAAGAAVTLVSATRGEAGQIRDAARATRATLGRVREQELCDAAGCLGVHDVRFFDHLDGTLRDIDRPLLVAEVAAVIEEVQPDVVLTFGADGAYGHPDHITIGEATTEAFLSRRPARSSGLAQTSSRTQTSSPAPPGGRLYYSHFPRSRLLLLDRLARWLAEMGERFHGPADFARAFSLFTQETTALGYADDQIDVGWFSPGIYIVEQGEVANSLFLILSGEVEVLQDQPDGTRQTLRRQGPGEFFGELALAHRSPRTANVVAVSSVTCMVFSHRKATLFAGRGTSSNLPQVAGEADDPPTAGPPAGATTVIDVRDFVDRKIAAIAAHRTQYPIEPSMFPAWMLQEMMGREYFVRRHPPLEPERDLLG
jgi:LmbE family N-acetylglucosaminyl deacetylase